MAPQSWIAIVLCVTVCDANPTRYINPEVIYGPPCNNGPEARCTAAIFDPWLANLTRFKAAKLAEVKYNPAAPNVICNHITWPQLALVQTLVMIEDQQLHNITTNEWTVESYVAGMRARYGALDNVMLWQAYPNLGVDNRNELDIWRSVGVETLRNIINRFHVLNVTITLATNLHWDLGLRSPPIDPIEEFMTFLIDVGADAAFGDTYSTMPYNYTQGALDRNQPWFVLEPEVGVFHNLSALATQAISTAYWGSEGGPGPPYDYQPPISLAKWLEPRHQVHLSQRWAKHRVDGTQFAWFNGIGYCVWTSVWGVRNPDTDRDVRQQKQMLTMLRYLAPVWNYPTVSLPLYPVNADCGGVYAWLRTYSAVDYPGYDDHTAYLQTSAIVINLVNRRSSPCVDHGSNTTAFDLHLNTTALNIHFVDPVLVDLYEGTQIPAVINSSSFFIKHTVGAGGIGCILVVESAALPTLSAIMATMAQLTAVPLSHYADVWQNPPQHLTPRPAASHPAHPLRLTSLVKPSGPFYFNVTGVWVEGPADFGAGVQFPWETEPVRNHSHWMNVSEFSIDTSLVLQQDYNCLKAHQNATFCSQQPLVSPALPAVNVTWHEAQHHCQQCGGRLPHDWEWQLAAQGLDNRTFPWGIAWNSSKIPPLDRSTAPRPADPVGRYPASQSPYGVQDLLGNVWQLTDQSCDDVTCFNIIRGSSLYYPSVARGTRWYLPSAHLLWQHNRLLVFGPDLDRSPYVGFRCVYS